ncbi:hypothetical protein GCM10011332_25920 [Terasakiella brassicae]|uniref:Cyclic nucleotide-binding domain-containing protein n=1 Tax=Terasakiella brassicae TaxID=1634917 RepID=A0A917C616_9PROT|nr:cyclic nucleotide-binding domain-containing protein [Terasakiella brassicae]GGF70740.1 hypothetical protein GCM10011332_25920 [Terasakiella brassicae]
MSTESFKTITYKPNTTLFQEGEQADFAYIIREGSVKISKRGPSGADIPIALVKKGGIVGEMAIVSEAPRSATVTAQEETIVLAISKTSFENKLQSVDPFLYSLIKTVIARLRQTSDHTVNLYEKIKKMQGKSIQSASPKSDLSQQKFANVNFIFADPNPQTRNSLRGGLFGLGFKEICDVSTLFQLREQIKKNRYDLLILDAAFGGREVAGFIHDIRHGIDCKNPFLSIIVLTQNKSPQNRDALLHAGCDHVLLKPISIEKISNAIKALCHYGRKFIVTHDYVGPDRMNYQNPNGESAPVFEVPNTLAAKVLNGARPEDLEHAIHDSLCKFNEIKLERHLVQLAWLMDRLTPDNPEGYDPNYLLDCIENSLQDLSIRIDQDPSKPANTICKNMHHLIDTIREDSTQRIEKLADMTLFYKQLCENIPLGQRARLSSPTARQA